jgi:hypothetical protein
VDRTVHAAATQQARVGGIDDRVDVKRRYVALDELYLHCSPIRSSSFVTWSDGAAAVRNVPSPPWPNRPTHTNMHTFAEVDSGAAAGLIATSATTALRTVRDAT